METALCEKGISVTDVDGNLSTVQLAVANGTVTVRLSGTPTISAGVIFTNSLTPSRTTLFPYTTLFRSSYQGTLNYNGPDTLTVTSRDSNAVTDVDTVAITVNPVNDAPVNTVPGAQVVNEGTESTGLNTSHSYMYDTVSRVQLRV